MNFGNCQLSSCPLSVLPSLLLGYALPTIFIALSLLRLLKNSHRLRPQERAFPPPGGSGIPLIGETLPFLVAKSSNRGFYDFIRARRVRYGNCFRTNIFGKNHVFVSGVQAAKLIFGDESAFAKTHISSLAEVLGEQSVLCASKQYHKLVRHKISTFLNRDTLTRFMGLFDELTMQVQAGWSQKETIIVLDEAFQITFRAVCKMLVSLEEEDQLRMLQKDIFLVCEAMLALPLRLPWTRFSRGLQARERIMRTLKVIIDGRRQGMENKQDFLQALLGIDDRGVVFTDAQIQDNILSLIIAGHITTATAIAWMVKYLDENQEVQQKLRNEHLSLAHKLRGSSFLGMEALNEMSYATKVVKETLRMSTIVGWFPLVALKDSEVGGFQVKKGWIVNVDARHIHMDQTVYENPAKFYPCRFQEDPKPYGFLAFGTGSRSCLGMNLAKGMMLVFLHRLVTTYRWEVIDHDQSLEEHSLFPMLRSGCPIRVAPVGPDPTQLLTAHGMDHPAL